MRVHPGTDTEPSGRHFRPPTLEGVPFALGQRLFVHHLFGRGIVGLIAVVAIVLLMRFWPVIVSWWERR